MKTVLQKLAQLWSLVGVAPKENLQPYYDEVVSLIIKKDSEKKNNASYTKFLPLADKLIETYRNVVGKGSKNGIPWTSSPNVIAQRLASPRLDLSKNTEEDIILACKTYLNDAYVNGDKKYCRTLQYFIWKEDGGFKSDLQDYLQRINESKENPEISVSVNDQSNGLEWFYKDDIE